MSQDFPKVTDYTSTFWVDPSRKGWTYYLYSLSYQSSACCVTQCWNIRGSGLRTSGFENRRRKNALGQWFYVFFQQRWASDGASLDESSLMEGGRVDTCKERIWIIKLDGFFNGRESNIIKHWDGNSQREGWRPDFMVVEGMGQWLCFSKCLMGNSFVLLWFGY